MTHLYRTVLILFSLSAGVSGLFCAIRPEKAIKLQIKFYAKINWKMEPINKGLEIRNTRLMGCFLIIVSCFAIALSRR